MVIISFKQSLVISKKVEPLENNKIRVTLNWNKPTIEPDKYIVYITEPTFSRIAVVDTNTFSEIVNGKGYYTYKVKAIYSDGSYAESLLITVGNSCCNSGGSLHPVPPVPPLPPILCWFHEDNQLIR